MAGGTCDISRLQIVENLDSLLKMFSILKSSIQSTGQYTKVQQSYF